MSLDKHVFYQNLETGHITEITTLCEEITFESYMEGEPSSLSMVVQEDPNNILELVNGSLIMFQVNGTGIFYGYIFTIETDATNTYKITAFDQMRYLKNEEVLVTANLTASQIFELVCSKNNLIHKVRHSSNFIVPEYFHELKTGYEVIQYGKDMALAFNGEFCFIRDEYGTIVFSELSRELTDFVIGDRSLLLNYSLAISIDEDTFNEVQVFQEVEAEGRRNFWVVKDSGNQQRWGVLRKMVKADDDSNEAQNQALAEQLLRLKNRETKTLTLNILGDEQTIFLKAGSGFKIHLEKFNFLQNVWIESITHSFFKDICTVQIEVFL